MQPRPPVRYRDAGVNIDEADRDDTIGEDLVNHCVNDIMVQGAEPLFFMDYFATGKLDAAVEAQVVGGIARGCRNNGCALIGGETAELPGFYAPGEYDLAGFIVGAAGRGSLLTGAGIRAGDCLLGLPSSGLHTNGYSLARALVGAGLLKGAAHITGGGITDNLPRILPPGLAARIETASWRVPPIFALLRRLGNIPEPDYRRTFNLGIGMILVVAKKDLAKAERILARRRQTSCRIGEVVKPARGARRQVVYV